MLLIHIYFTRFKSETARGVPKKFHDKVSSQHSSILFANRDKIVNRVFHGLQMKRRVEIHEEVHTTKPVKILETVPYR